MIRTVWHPVHEIWSGLCDIVYMRYDQGLCDILYMRYDQDCVISCTWDMIRTVWYPVQEIFQKQEMCPSTFRFTRGIHRFNQPRSKTVFSWECQGYQSLVVYSPPGLIMGAAILEISRITGYLGKFPKPLGIWWIPHDSQVSGEFPRFTGYYGNSPDS